MIDIIKYFWHYRRNLQILNLTRDFVDHLLENVGDSADYTIHIQGDEKEILELVDKMNELKRILDEN